ncbi:MAG: hypothetical protein JO369_01010 [Paucibacter sp.]|nr:hypothetical protein [Roseateles sp.]
MLRRVVLVLALLAFVVGLAMLAQGQRDGVPVAIWSGILLLAVLFERWRYGARQGPADAGWVRTDERFVDPESGETMQVWYDPRSGERRYEKASD